MIIKCINCIKKFNVDDNAIPKEGRQIQCGSCRHSWFFIVEEKSLKTKNDDNKSNKNEADHNSDIKKEIQTDVVFDNSLSSNDYNDITAVKDNYFNKTKYRNIIKKNIFGNFFSYIVVFIISFVALIILVDTLKSPLINMIPVLEIILFNLFETLKDIKLFVIDLT